MVLICPWNELLFCKFRSSSIVLRDLHVHGLMSQSLCTSFSILLFSFFIFLGVSTFKILGRKSLSILFIWFSYSYIFHTFDDNRGNDKLSNLFMGCECRFFYVRKVYVFLVNDPIYMSYTGDRFYYNLIVNK